MTNRPLRQSLHFCKWVSLTLIMVLGIAMAIGTFHESKTLGEGRETIDRLKEGNLDDPSLAQTVRDLDYLYRSAYFQTRDKKAYGLLVLAITFFILCFLNIIEYYWFPPVLEVPKQRRPPSESERRRQLVFTICGIILMFLCLAGLRTTFIQDSTVTVSSGDEQNTKDTQAEGFDETITGQPVTGQPDTGQLDTVKAPAAEKIVLAKALEEATHHWPSFRGSLLPNKNALPPNWNFHEKWKVKIPLEGFNSPVIWGDNVFVAGGDKARRAIFCYDGKDGTHRWTVASTTAPVYPELTEDTGVSAPTLSVDKDRVYGIFATGEILCCDHTGKAIWRRQLPIPDILYGYASSPLLLGDRLIVQYDMEEQQTLYAIDVYTGKDVWKSKRETSASWSSPTALVKDDKIIIFTAGNTTAEGIDGNTGEVLWKNKDMGGEVATTASAHNDAFYFSNSGAITCAFNALNGEILFESKYVPAPDVASPIVFENRFILFLSGGSVIAVDAKNGEEIYEENFDNGFYASPVVVGNKIVAANMDGDLFLMTPSPKGLTIDGTWSIGTRVVSIPAFYKGMIIIRTADNNLICLESQEEGVQ